MGIIVMKFGGKAVADAAGIRLAADRVLQAIEASKKNEASSTLDSVLVVVSAMSGVTDSLFQAAKAAEDADLSVAKRVCAELKARHVSAARLLAPKQSAGSEAEIESIIAALDSRLQGVRLVGELSDRNMDEIAA
ncbi:MAG: hypothetical protein WC820_01350, partial [Spirochaetales bacterium]